MIRIGICDDDVRMRQQIRRVCCETVERNGEEAAYILFRGGREVLSYPDSLDILILDIEMPEMNGIEVKKRLERIRDHTLILYVTSHVEFMQEAFGTYVFGFVDKQYLEEQLSGILRDAIQSVRRSTVYVEGVVDSRKIFYIHSEHVYGNLILNDGTKILVRSPMQELEDSLKCVDFVRTHRSYLVNLLWVDGIRDNKVCIMEHRIPLSRSRAGEVREAFRKYCWGNGRYC